MNNIEFKKIVQEITSKYGFMYCKKNYYYNSDKIIVVINLQKSNFDNSYYINYGAELESELPVCKFKF